MRGAKLLEANNLEGTDMREGALMSYEKGKGGFVSDLYKCTLDNAILCDANLSRANLLRSSIQNANLTDATPYNAETSGANMAPSI